MEEIKQTSGWNLGFMLPARRETNEERVFCDLTLWQPEISRLCLCVLLWRRHSVSMRPLIWTWAPLFNTITLCRELERLLLLLRSKHRSSLPDLITAVICFKMHHPVATWWKAVSGPQRAAPANRGQYWHVSSRVGKRLGSSVAVSLTFSEIFHSRIS